MTDKLSRYDLLGWLNFWHDYCGEDCIPSCVGGIPMCEQAYKQIVALIKKPIVVEREETASNARDAYGGYREDE